MHVVSTYQSVETTNNSINYGGGHNSTVITNEDVIESNEFNGATDGYDGKG